MTFWTQKCEIRLVEVRINFAKDKKGKVKNFFSDMYLINPLLAHARTCGIPEKITNILECCASMRVSNWLRDYRGNYLSLLQSTAASSTAEYHLKKSTLYRADDIATRKHEVERKKKEGQNGPLVTRLPFIYWMGSD